MRLLLAALALALPASAADVNKRAPITQPPRIVMSPSLTAAPSIPTVQNLPAAQAPGVALPALPQASHFTLDASVARPIAAELPSTAIGLAPVYFQQLNAAQQPAASNAPIASAIGQSRVGAVETSAASVFDGSASLSQRSFAPPQAPKGAPSVQAPRTQQTLTGRALLASLHEQSGRGQKVHDYDEARRYMFSTADQVQVSGVWGVIDAYSGTFEPGRSGDGADYPEHGDQNGDGWEDKQGMNTEHLWPQSFFDKKLPMRSDLHHLMATFIHPNGVRGTLPFGVVTGKPSYENKAGAKIGKGVFEPPDAAKGRVARGLLYFYTRYYDRNITNGGYNDAFWNATLPTLLDWNRRFPPTDWERRRNDLVEKWQGNRNPFVDDHALADQVGLEGFTRQGRTLEARVEKYRSRKLFRRH